MGAQRRTVGALPRRCSLALLWTCCGVLVGLARAQDFPGGSERLVHLNIVYRHGDRAPITLYPKDPNNEAQWPRGMGELTKEGCRMHYKLGSFLRAHYSNFITGDPKEISVQSSDKDRCLDSASCHLAGMYRPSADQRFLPGLPWQPVPVHTRPNDEDGLLAPGNGNCPNADRAYEKLKQTDEARQFIKKYAALYNNLTQWSGENVTDWDSAGHIYDTVMIEQLYGLQIPQWAVDVYPELELQQDQSFVWYVKTEQLQRLRGGLLAKQILKNLKQVTQQPTDVRVNMYSTHDTEVASLLALYNLFDGKAPKYCSTVLVELWQDVQSASYTVKVLRLRYEDMRPRQILRISLADFEKRISAKLPGDWASECGRPNTDSASAAATATGQNTAASASSSVGGRLVLPFASAGAADQMPGRGQYHHNQHRLAPNQQHREEGSAETSELAPQTITSRLTNRYKYQLFESGAPVTKAAVAASQFG